MKNSIMKNSIMKVNRVGCNQVNRKPAFVCSHYKVGIGVVNSS
ncbi:hypothetical protein SAMN04488491_0370 [Psychrobacter sp. LV10R520-6]|nr:hypothetical protein SAMN04488491_0370 [Psychrobacter sp. LV10R520-6]